MEEKGKWGDRVFYFMLGGFVGATVALLFAPRSGEETREIIATKVREGKDAISDKIKQAKGKISESSHRLETNAKDFTSRSKEAISAALEAGKQAYREEKDAADKRKA